MEQRESEIDKLFQEELARQLNISRIEQFDEQYAVEQESASDLERWKSIE